MFFKNEMLRGAGETVPMTEEEIKEYIRCKKSIFHFAKYFTIIGPAGEEKMHLRPYQEKIVTTICAKIPEKNNRIIMMGRQTGKTTIATLYILWYALFHKSKCIAVLANKASQAEEILLRIKNAYIKLPLWLQQGLVKWNGGEILMENETKIFTGASSSSSVRGKSIDLLLVDEFAFIDDNMAEKFMQSVFPTQAAKKDAMMILISTPKGMNHFYNIWTKAVAGKNSFIPCKIQWFEVEGRDEAWLQKQIRDNGEQFVNQEYKCLTGDSEVTVKDDNGLVQTLTLEQLYLLEQEQLVS
jgi:phage terminase large subunit-like protein